MAYDQGLAQRLRERLVDQPGLEEKKMFGGLSFLVKGNLACGVIGEDLIVRVGPQGDVEALAQPYTRQFDFTGRPMSGWVVVAPEGIAEDEQLESWVRRGVSFAGSLPPK